uniref:Uncharacterized protein n=1 Tax=Physcomitrium patens TaxID=3218 RepID=A0A2K1KZU5_PHYPA|nr:hypothetical protein PHYPA_002061 [Physcomitrium patens]
MVPHPLVAPSRGVHRVVPGTRRPPRCVRFHVGAVLVWLIKSIKFIKKLVKWALLLQKYGFEVMHQTYIINLNTNILSHNPSFSKKDLIKV